MGLIPVEKFTSQSFQRRALMRAGIFKYGNFTFKPHYKIVVSVCPFADNHADGTGIIQNIDIGQQ